MSTTDQLDSFETALLTELRREVAEHPAPAPTTRRQPRRRLKVAATGAVAAVAATVAAIGLTPHGAPTTAPAFAVAGNPDGSVALVVHRLDDADGLEAALAEHGIDATVRFVPTPDGQLPPKPDVDGTWSSDEPGPGNPCGIDDGPGPAMLLPAGYARGLGKNRVELDTLPVGAGEFSLEFPADSPILSRKVILDVGSPGSFWMTYPSATHGEWCGFGQSQALDAGRGTVLQPG